MDRVLPATAVTQSPQAPDSPQLGRRHLRPTLRSGRARGLPTGAAGSGTVTRPDRDPVSAVTGRETSTSAARVTLVVKIPNN